MHQVTLPIHRFSSRFQERGCHAMEISRLECRHPALAGRRAVHLSDLHLDHYHPRHDAVIAQIALLKPDWIFVTGDLLTMPEGLPSLIRFLSGLRALAPVYLTLGNHDHHSGIPIDRFGDLADRHKLDLLINQVSIIPHAQGELCIVGLDDPSLHRADSRCIPQTVPGRFTLVLAHAPNVLDLLEKRHTVDLILCGHSHGGQWKVPYLPTFWLPYGCGGRKHGYYEKNGHRMYVNRGLGWSLLPIRLSCPPEIVVIDWT
jgi:predicted MPP superfamily phosphohydrolase